ncbi:hypothetical protein [Streptomyces apocyni]|uniref:hypothetical protein n=1 Tax=Streptomyces apocyni TaxID=2654677 RepID=UPI0012EAED2A|nr:hypothetical protein [Streptomyces apocyni]
MSTRALLVLLLLVLVGMATVGPLVYFVHRHAASRVPVSVGLAAAGALGTLVSAVIQAGTSEAAPAPATAPA